VSKIPRKLPIKDNFKLLQLKPSEVFFWPCTREERPGLVKALHAANSYYMSTERMEDSIYTVSVERDVCGVMYGLKRIEK